MAIDSGDLVGGGGVFVPGFISTGIDIFSGAGAGILFNLVPPTGERVKLIALEHSNQLPGTTLKVGDVSVINSKILSDNGNADNRFAVGTNLSRTPDEIIGGVDETIQLITTTTTTSTFSYVYATGVLR